MPLETAANGLWLTSTIWHRNNGYNSIKRLLTILKVLNFFKIHIISSFCQIIVKNKRKLIC